MKSLTRWLAIALLWAFTLGAWAILLCFAGFVLAVLYVLPWWAFPAGVGFIVGAYTVIITLDALHTWASKRRDPNA